MESKVLNFLSYFYKYYDIKAPENLIDINSVNDQDKLIDLFINNYNYKLCNYVFTF